MDPGYSGLPTFLVIGARKSATSSLYELLRQHPDVCMSQPKEPCFFSHKKPWERGLDWYRSVFSDPTKPIRGESSVDYGVPTVYKDVIPRIVDTLPATTKFIFIARHPIRRIESEWKMHYPVGWYGTMPFEEVVWTQGLLDASLYYQQMMLYVSTFGRDKLHICFYEDFVVRPIDVATECLCFIGADVGKLPPVTDVPHALNSRGRPVNRHPMIGRALKHPWADLFRQFLPTSLQSVTRRLLKSKQPLLPPWTPPMLDRLRAVLVPDAKKFLEMAGKPLDFWRFEP